MKHLLIQYIDMKVEIKETIQRIKDINEELDSLNTQHMINVTKGGSAGKQIYHIDGYPADAEDEKRYRLSKYKRILTQREADISDKLLEVEEYLNSMDDTRMRRLLTKRFIEGKKWYQVAEEMGTIYTEESCRKQVERFLDNLK